MQHHHAPRPLPLFLELLREVGERDPQLARQALAGLRAYEDADRVAARAPYPTIHAIGGTSLRDLGGDGSPCVLIPSLINPPHILDLDEETSLAAAMRAAGRHIYLVDWGAASRRSALDVTAHVAELLVPLLRHFDRPPAIIGYCLGGTMAIAAANLIETERVATIACPWHFDRYPGAARQALEQLWRAGKPTAEALGAMPMELLQAAFWSLDPERTVAKFAKFGTYDQDSAEARRFVALEDWANEGEALPLPAASELIDGLFGQDLTGSGKWRVDGMTISDRMAVPLLNLTAANDRIAPSDTAPDGPTHAIAAGHVGMLVGARKGETHRLLADFLVDGERSRG